MSSYRPFVGADAWDGRYDRPDYLFGTEPSRFLVDHAPLLPRSGSALVVGDGEGRNGAWLAARGLAVTAFDVSPRAHEKALDLDRALGVSVDRHVCGVEAWTFAPGTWDVIVAAMVQFAPPPVRDAMFAAMRDALRPGGLAMVHGYTPKQLDYGTGGPPVADHMYTSDLLSAAFDGFDIVVLREYEDDLAEGAGHVGRSALIDLVARRPAGAV